MFLTLMFITLMFIVGTQDAVDLLFGTTVAGRPGDGLFQAGGDASIVVNDGVEPQSSTPDSGLPVERPT